MSDLFRIIGSYESLPKEDPTSGDPGDIAVIDERLYLLNKLSQRLTLPSDLPFAVPVLAADGGPFVAGAHVLQVKAYGGKVTVRITTTDGATQAVPVDSWLSLICLSVPITAIDFTRVSGNVNTVIKLFMGEKL